MSDKPFAQSCSNASERFTCPGCYEDFPDARRGTFTCAKCGRKVACQIEMVPVYTAKLVGDDDEG